MERSDDTVTPGEDRERIREEIGDHGDGRLRKAVAVLEESGSASHDDDLQIPPMPDSLRERIAERYGSEVVAASPRRTAAVRGAPATGSAGWLARLRQVCTSPPWVLGGLATACFAIGIWTLAGLGDPGGGGAGTTVRGPGGAPVPGGVAVVILAGGAEVDGLRGEAVVRADAGAEVEQALGEYAESIRIVVRPDGTLSGYRAGEDEVAESRQAGDFPRGAYDAVIELDGVLRNEPAESGSED